MSSARHSDGCISQPSRPVRLDPYRLRTRPAAVKPALKMHETPEQDGPTGPTQLLLDLSAARGLSGSGDARRSRNSTPEITEANAVVHRMLSAPDSWERGLVALVGPAGSGKTTLAEHVHSDLRRLSADDVERFERNMGSDEATEPVVDLLLDMAARKVFLFDDFDRAVETGAGADFERGAFHLLNRVAETGSRLILTGRSAPSRWPINLPDLKSRLEAATLARIEDPDDALLRAILRSGFSARGVSVEDDVLKYLSSRMERSYEAAQQMVARLDAESLRLKRPVTISLAGAVLGWVPNRF